MEKKLSGMTEHTMLPPEQALADEFRVSKPTLRRALQELADAGKIRKINGVGIEVIQPPRSISRELIFVCHDIVFFSESLKSFGARAAELNYFISIVPLAGDARTQERILLSAAERRPAGMVIYADPRQQELTAFQQLAASRIPALYVIRLPQGIDNNLLEFGNADGLVEIVETFYSRGCRRIASSLSPCRDAAACSPCRAHRSLEQRAIRCARDRPRGPRGRSRQTLDRPHLLLVARAQLAG
ncbi:MAG: GntR family transcriptional regulator [Sphingobacteriia bacterium]|nr:GntR family transcriptional regulator [Sphingobacteriia bacterium]